ncbi:MAG: ThiF family adenylyltransferase, partial [Candidatus Heimdallarchaeota archaeon]
IFGIDNLDDYNYDSVIVIEAAIDKKKEKYRLPSYENEVWAITTKTSAAISSEKLEYDKCDYNVLQPSLSAITAGLTATEVLRRNLLIRVSEILDTNLQLRFVMQQKGILKTCRELEQEHKGLPFKIRMKIGGESVPCTYEPFTETQIVYGPGGRSEKIKEEPDRVILHASLPKSSFMKRFFVEQMEVLEHYPQGHFKPIEELIISPFPDSRIEKKKIKDAKVKIPEFIDDKKIFFLGIGGLGSWTTLLINISNTRNCTLVLNDHDDEVEEHNLNRQILFNKSSIGKPKVVAAEEKLKKINPSNKLVSLPFELDIGSVNCIINEDFMTLEDYNTQKGRTSSEPLIEDFIFNLVREEPVIANELKDTDVFVCGPDNIRVRYVSSLLGKLLGINVVNAGAERFEGKVDLFEADGDCYICRYGEDSKYKQEIVSCTGKIPIPSIVTTISTIGSIQALLALVK